MNKLYQKINIAKTQLQLSEELYRSILEEQTGKRSLKEMSYKELVKVLNSFKACGFKVQKTKNKDSFAPKQDEYCQKPQIAKIEAILAEIGRIKKEYISWNYALGILKQMFSKEDWEDATQKELKAVITALTKELDKLEKNKAKHE